MKYQKFIRLFLVPVLTFSFLFNVPYFPTAFVPPAHAETRIPNADEIHEMMGKLSKDIPAIEKKRLTAIIFAAQDVYRKAVIQGKYPADSPNVQAFIKNKAQMQIEVAERMNVIHRNKYGTNIKEPIIPFAYNNILSDDDIITGSGKAGSVLEPLYAQALDELVHERAGRPMAPGDRQRIDVNGLAWDMTQEGAIDNFWDKEKYLNPQSGYANQIKLAEAGDNLTVITFDENGRRVMLKGDEAKNAIRSLVVDKPLDIPGMNLERGTGSMSDYYRMAEIHKVKFDGLVTEEQIATFIRNQKYSQRLEADFAAIAAGDNPELAKKYKDYMELAAKLRKQTTAKGVAELLAISYPEFAIIDANGNVDFKQLTKAMKKHQARQLTKLMPELMGAVQKNESYKILKWLKENPSGRNRRLLRKQLALTYAPLSDKKVQAVLADLDKLDADDAQKAWLKKVITGDAKQIRNYAKHIQIPPDELVKHFKLEGDNMAVVDFIESKNVKVRALNAAMAKRPGGSKFKDFLKSKTAKALNLDVMLDGGAGEKMMGWSMLILAAARGYAAAGKGESGLKTMGIAMFEMVPFVSGFLRFSEDDFKQAFKEFAMDILPPLALAEIARVTLKYVAESAIHRFITEPAWNRLVKEAVADMSDADFVKGESGYYRLKDRQSLLNFLEEVGDGFGRVYKLAPMVVQDVDAMTERDPRVQANKAAMHTLQYLETFDSWMMQSTLSKEFSIEQIKSRVWKDGIPEKGTASNVQRVASLLILENLAIRAEMYTLALQGFIDRIERYWNEQKDDEGGDCDPRAIIEAALATITGLYEGAPQEIKDDADTNESLTIAYENEKSFLSTYDGGAGRSFMTDSEDCGKDEIALRQEMQDRIDAFKELIERLRKGVALEREMEVMQLTGYVYPGGKTNFETGDTVALGDEFRVGISARVDPKRASQGWNVFYYLFSNVTQSFVLLGQVGLNPQDYKRGQGLWVISPPEKKTFFHVDHQGVDPEFIEEGDYVIYPVLAFGGWSDPVAEVGMAAVVQPVAHADLFEDRVAFAGAPFSFKVIRSILVATMPKTVYIDQDPDIKFYFKEPVYLKNSKTEVSFQVTAPNQSSPEPKVDPKVVKNISADEDNPSMAKINMPNKPDEGVYYVWVKPKILGVKQEFNAIGPVVIFEYTDQGDPQEVGDRTADEVLAPLLEKMKGFKSSAEGVLNEARAIEASVKQIIDGINQKTQNYEAELSSLESSIDQFIASMSGVSAKVLQAQTQAKQASEEAKKSVDLKDVVENKTLDVCETTQTMKNTNDSNKIKSLMQAIEGKYSSVTTKVQEYFTHLQNAQGTNDAITGIIRELEFYRAQRDQIAAQVAQKEDLSTDYEAELTKASEQLAGFEKLKARLAGIKEDAGSALEEAERITAAKIHPNDVPRRTQIRDLATEIEAIQGIDAIEESAKKHLSDPSAKVEELNAKLKTLKIKAKDMKESYLPDEVFQELKNALLDAQSNYDAATLFQGAVEKAAANAKICYDVAKDLANKDKTPEQMEAEKDCSHKRGSIAKYHRRKKTVLCQCPPKTKDLGDRCKRIDEDGDDGSRGSDGDDDSGQGDDAEAVDTALGTYGTREGGQGRDDDDYRRGDYPVDDDDDDPFDDGGYDDFTDGVDDYAEGTGVRSRTGDDDDDDDDTPPTTASTAATTTTTPTGPPPVTQLSGNCSGSVRPSKASGYAGDSLSFFITIAPPESKLITRVTTDNPLCHNCDARKVSEGSYQWDTKFQGKGGWSLKFIAYDAQKKVMCSGASTGMQSLGARP